MFDRWFAAVKTAFDEDRGTNDGWGPADRYEAKMKCERLSHEGIVAASLEKARFRREHSAYVDAPRQHADGVVSHPDHEAASLRYELKSVFLPHYHSDDHPHNHDFERLLRLEHPNGALGDVERLKGTAEALKVFLLVGIAWTDPNQASRLPLYERHRDVLLGTFATLADLSAPTAQHAIAGAHKPWSAVIYAWMVD